MNHGSAFTYCASSSEEEFSEDEELSSTDLADNSSSAAEEATGPASRGFWGFLAPSRGEAHIAAPRPPPAPVPQRTSRSRTGRERRKIRCHATTNVISVDLKALGDDAALQTGEPIFCSNCGACVSQVSALEPASMASEEDYVWTCEFCRTVNRISLHDGELPVKGCSSVDYIIEPAPAAATTIDSDSGGGSAPSPAEKHVVYVLDVSGSMCVTSECPGRVSLRGDRVAELAALRQEGDDGNQWLPGQSRDVTYVSRLQHVQAAVNAQLEAMKDTGGTASLISFSDQVTIYGDGAGTPTTIRGDRLVDLEFLLRAGREAASELLARPATTAANAASLSKRLFDLVESGPTALGPAVAVALGLTQGLGADAAGSKVVLCTDGLANVGLGALDDETSREASVEFYKRIGQAAREQGISIDVISIKGDEADLEAVGLLTELTSGEVTQVDPLDLQTDNTLKGILSGPILATNVSIRVILHSGLQFRDASTIDQTNKNTPLSSSDSAADCDVAGVGQGGRAQGGGGNSSSSSSSSSSSRTRHVGNATDSTSISLEYTVKSRAERVALGLLENTHLPFQLQIAYTKLDGMRCLRVISEMRPIATDKDTVATNAQMAVLSSHACQQGANLAGKGDYRSARANTRAYSHLMKRCAKSEASKNTLEAFHQEVFELDQEIRSALESTVELSHGGGSSEELYEARRVARSRNDRLSTLIYKSKKAGTRKFSEHRGK